MSGNIITRREFNISRMKKEFPRIPIDIIANAQWELEMEYPRTDWEEQVYYDTGKLVKPTGNVPKSPVPGPSFSRKLKDGVPNKNPKTTKNVPGKGLHGNPRGSRP